MNLFDFANPAAHTGDPGTSHDAADRITRSGARSRGCAVVLALVRAHPGSTACELWEAATDADRDVLREMQRVRQRLTDLRAAGAVCQGSQRRCRVRPGSTMVTWYPVGE